MTIKVYADRIEIGAKTITTTPTGIRIGDSLAANTQQQGYINQANFTARELAFGNFVFQGSVAGFTAGGYKSPASVVNTIDKFPFATDTDASDHGDLTAGSYSGSGQSSSIHGYNSSGRGVAPLYVTNNVIEKFLFSSKANATDVGDLSFSRRMAVGQSSSVSGYACGGSTPAPSSNVIEKFPFATDTNSTDVGDMLEGKEVGSSQSSATHGYNSGGAPVSNPSARTNTIEKFPFASDTNSTDVANLSEIIGYSRAGQSSTTHGYRTGGSGPSPASVDVNTIDKFPFATDIDASDIGNLSAAKSGVAGQSSTTHGYASGGQTTPPPVFVNTIDKFPFSADTNASDVADLSEVRFFSAGTQF